MEKEGIPTSETMERRRNLIKRSEFEGYKLKVDYLTGSKITSSDEIDEVRDFIKSYDPSSNKYKGAKQKLLDRLQLYESKLKR